MQSSFALLFHLRQLYLPGCKTPQVFLMALGWCQRCCAAPAGKGTEAGSTWRTLPFPLLAPGMPALLLAKPALSSALSPPLVPDLHLGRGAGGCSGPSASHPVCRAAVSDCRSRRTEKQICNLGSLVRGCCCCCCFISLVIASFLQDELLHSYFWLCFTWKPGRALLFGRQSPALAIYCLGVVCFSLIH